MFRKFLSLLIVLFTLMAATPSAKAALFYDAPPLLSTIFGESPMDKLTNKVTKMSQLISESSSQMMKIGDMLICNSFHGQAAYAKITIDTWFGSFNLAKFRALALQLFTSGVILYALGFFITVIASFYMFDVAFNLSIALFLLPLTLALWPFAWTKGKLKDVVLSIAYYTGVFIFLPLGILIGKQLVVDVINSVLPEGSDFMTMFKEDRADDIQDTFGFFTLSFLKILVAYIAAIRLIPLMAGEFCSYFFGKSLVGSPMSEKLTQMSSALKRQTIGKAGKFAKDVAKHKAGKWIESKGDKKGGFMDRVIARYGKQMAKNKK